MGEACKNLFKKNERFISAFIALMNGVHDLMK